MDNSTLNTWSRIKDSDIYYSFIKSPTAIISSVILLLSFFKTKGCVHCLISPVDWKLENPYSYIKILK